MAIKVSENKFTFENVKFSLCDGIGYNVRYKDKLRLIKKKSNK